MLIRQRPDGLLRARRSVTTATQRLNITAGRESSSAERRGQYQQDCAVRAAGPEHNGHRQAHPPTARSRARSCPGRP